MRYILGFLLLILGILGVIFPVLPGIPFLVAAAFLFGIIDEKKFLTILKKFKTDKRDTFVNKIINYIIIKYIHKKKIPSKSDKKYNITAIKGVIFKPWIKKNI